jgi:hypothetical protein
MLETSPREMRPCLRSARMISASPESKRMGATKREIFFVPVASLGDIDGRPRGAGL